MKVSIIDNYLNSFINFKVLQNFYAKVYGLKLLPQKLIDDQKTLEAAFKILILNECQNYYFNG